VDRGRVITSPARYGLTRSGAERDLATIGAWAEQGPAPEAVPVLDVISRTADPDLTLASLVRLRDCVDDWPTLYGTLRADARFRGRLLAVLGGSRALGDALCARPDLWRALTEVGIAELAGPIERMLRAIGADPHAPEPRALGGERACTAALQRTYRELLCQIAGADLGQLVEPSLPPMSYLQVTGALTGLAEAALRAALAVAAAETLGEADAPCALVVIAMGKCGGRELNYVSDVDVVFAGEGDLLAAEKLAAGVCRVCGSAAFEVDVALRPEGDAGALVRSLEGHVSYYRRWARTWEFQALLKARPVAGTFDLGARYLAAVSPMVWAAADREDFVADVQSMRRRVETHVPDRLRERELKLGRGGLRDVEFAVQLLQLVHGRADESIRQASTVEALQALGSGGYVGRSDAAELADSYRFLRTLEHRLQLQKLRRTHVFPAENDAAGLRWLARASGVHPEKERDAGHELLREFRRHSRRIRRLHEKLFYRPLLEAVSHVPSDALRMTAVQARARAAALGFVSPRGTLAQLDALTGGTSRAAAIQAALLPAMLDMLAETPDPDRGLLSYRKLSEALAGTPWYLRLLRDGGPVVQRLCTVLGYSNYVPGLIERAPDSLRLLADDEALSQRDPAHVASALRTAVCRHAGLDDAVTTARSLRRHELVRVGAADVLGLLDVRAVCAALSGVWMAVLGAVLAAVQRVETANRTGDIPARIAVIGMGRLGGGELGYASDADVLFVCEPVGGADDDTAVRYAARVAQTTREALGAPSADPPLILDADLRPEGRSGPVVRTLDSYRVYYEKWASGWEHQALARARPVAGDEELGERFLHEIDHWRYPHAGLGVAGTREIRRMKARVESERLPRGSDASLNTKLGRGGLADVEWTAQLLTLQHAGEEVSLRTPSTLGVLEAAAAAGLVTEQDARVLAHAWLLATRARNATMLVRGKPADQIPGSGREAVAVAGLCGFAGGTDPGEFLDYYRRTGRHARQVVQRIFYGRPE
jgi:glutamate-ammonia-ligase adenylyltransferase